VGPQFVDGGFGQDFAGGVESLGTQVIMRLLDTGQHRVENLHRFSDNLRPDPVTRDYREFHRSSHREVAASWRGRTGGLLTTGHGLLMCRLPVITVV